MKLEMGCEVEDLISGFKGIVTGTAKYITGCTQALVQPKMKAGSFVEGRWIDVDRLKVTKVNRLSLALSTNGSDKPAPIR
jgi:hypothetical protein